MRSRAFWAEESQWGDSDDLRTPHTSTAAATAFSTPPEHATNDEEDEEDEAYPGRRIKQSENRINDEKTKDNCVALQMDNINSVNMGAVEEMSQRKDCRYRLRHNPCLGGQNGQLNLKMRIFCEQMTSVSYPTGRFMVSQHFKEVFRL